MAKFGKNTEVGGDELNKKAPFSKRPKPNKPGRVTVKTCTLCQSPSRDQIERLIVLGVSQREVIRLMEERGEKFSTRAMSNHKTKHMSLDDDVARRAIEKRAHALTGDVEDIADTVITTHGILDVMRTQAFKRIVDDAMEYAPGDVFNLLDRIDKIESEQRENKIEHMMRDMNALIAAIKEVVAESDWNRLVSRWEFHRDKQERMVAGHIEDAKAKVVEAEVVKKPKKAKKKDSK